MSHVASSVPMGFEDGEEFFEPLDWGRTAYDEAAPRFHASVCCTPPRDNRQSGSTGSNNSPFLNKTNVSTENRAILATPPSIRKSAWVEDTNMWFRSPARNDPVTRTPVTTPLKDILKKQNDHVDGYDGVLMSTPVRGTPTKRTNAVLQQLTPKGPSELPRACQSDEEFEDEDDEGLKLHTVHFSYSSMNQLQFEDNGVEPIKTIESYDQKKEREGGQLNCSPYRDDFNQPPQSEGEENGLIDDLKLSKKSSVLSHTSEITQDELVLSEKTTGLRAKCSSHKNRSVRSELSSAQSGNSRGGGGSGTSSRGNSRGGDSIYSHASLVSTDDSAALNMAIAIPPVRVLDNSPAEAKNAPPCFSPPLQANALVVPKRLFDEYDETDGNGDLSSMSSQQQMPSLGSKCNREDERCLDQSFPQNGDGAYIEHQNVVLWQGHDGDNVVGQDQSSSDVLTRSPETDQHNHEGDDVNSVIGQDQTSGDVLTRSPNHDGDYVVGQDQSSSDVLTRSPETDQHNHAEGDDVNSVIGQDQSSGDVLTRSPETDQHNHAEGDGVVGQDQSSGDVDGRHSSTSNHDVWLRTDLNHSVTRLHQSEAQNSLSQEELGNTWVSVEVKSHKDDSGLSASADQKKWQTSEVDKGNESKELVHQNHLRQTQSKSKAEVEVSDQSETKLFSPVGASPSTAHTPNHPTLVRGNDAVPLSLGDEWKSTNDAKGRRYFYNRRTRQTAWQPPQGLVKILVSPGQFRLFTPTPVHRQQITEPKTVPHRGIHQVKEVKKIGIPLSENAVDRKHLVEQNKTSKSSQDNEKKTVKRRGSHAWGDDNKGEAIKPSPTDLASQSKLFQQIDSMTSSSSTTCALTPNSTMYQTRPPGMSDDEETETLQSNSTTTSEDKNKQSKSQKSKRSLGSLKQTLNSQYRTPTHAQLQPQQHTLHQQQHGVLLDQSKRVQDGLNGGSVDRSHVLFCPFCGLTSCSTDIVAHFDICDRANSVSFTSIQSLFTGVTLLKSKIHDTASIRSSFNDMPNNNDAITSYSQLTSNSTPKDLEVENVLVLDNGKFGCCFCTRTFNSKRSAISHSKACQSVFSGERTRTTFDAATKRVKGTPQEFIETYQKSPLLHAIGSEPSSLGRQISPEEKQLRNHPPPSRHTGTPPRHPRRNGSHSKENHVMSSKSKEHVRSTEKRGAPLNKERVLPDVKGAIRVMT